MLKSVNKLEIESQVLQVFQKEKNHLEDLREGEADMSVVGNHCFTAYMVI